MSRIRVLHERRINGLIIRLQDTPDTSNGYRVAIIRETEFNDYHTAMDHLRAVVKDAEAKRIVFKPGP